MLSFLKTLILNNLLLISSCDRLDANDREMKSLFDNLNNLKEALKRIFEK
jgi:hypothetical protein